MMPLFLLLPVTQLCIYVLFSCPNAPSTRCMHHLYMALPLRETRSRTATSPMTADSEMQLQQRAIGSWLSAQGLSWL